MILPAQCADIGFHDTNFRGTSFPFCRSTFLVFTSEFLTRLTLYWWIITPLFSYMSLTHLLRLGARPSVYDQIYPLPLDQS